MIHNSWTHQPNVQSNPPEDDFDEQKQRYIHDIFANSNERPISAPPSSSDDVNVINGLGRSKYSSSTSSMKTWGERPLYSDSSHTEESNSDEVNSIQQFQLQNQHFNFDQFRENQNDNLNYYSSGLNRIGSESVPTGLGLFPTSENNSLNSSNHSLYENDFDVMQIGSRRSSSTGIIGPNSRMVNSSSVMESLGMIPSDSSHSMRKQQKPIMDLIEEDFPKSQASEDFQYQGNFQSQKQYHTMNNSSSVPINQPPSTNLYNIPTQTLMGSRTQLNNFSSVNNKFDGNNLGQNQPNRYSTNGFHQGNVRPNHQHVQNSHFEGMYSSSVGSGVQGQSSHPHQHLAHQQTSQPSMYYNDLQTREVGPSTQQMNQSGQSQSMYVKPAPYSGYTAVQYQSQGNNHSFQQSTPMVIHSNDLPKYFSAMSVQGSVPAQVPTNGTIIYFQQPSGNNVPPTNVVAANNVSNNTKTVRSPSSKNAPKNGNAGKKNGRGKNNSSVEHNSKSASSVLEEFRAEKNHSRTAFDITGHVVEFCQDQNGSRFIQQRLEVANDDEKVFIMNEILPDINQLRIDIFGNYVVQKLFDFGTDEMIQKVKQTIVGEVFSLSKHMYGCRVVQKALEIVSDEDLLELLSELHGNMLPCIHDQNGNHVIQKYIEVVNKKTSLNEKKGNMNMALRFKQETKVVLDCVTEDIRALACHPYGCRVFQRILEHFTEERKDEVLNCIKTFHQDLLDDQYGNYVIQHVLRYGREIDRDSILKIVVKNSLLHLSRQKFASNVVEKLLKFGNDKHRKAIVREMLKQVQTNGADGSKDESTVVLMMVRDAYANYVVQTTLDVVPEGEEKKLLYEELNNNASLLRNFTFAKHIITKLGV